jgi:anti-repressor protein
MNELEIFKNEEFGEVRVIEKDGEPWFVAKDICNILGLEARDSVRYLDDDEKSNVSSKHIGQNGGRDPLVINESGLYSLILKSRKPEAKKFKKWITSEVLPTIRKTGGYLTDGVDWSNLDNIQRVLDIAKQEKAKRIKAEKRVEEDRPKVEFYEAVTGAETAIDIGTVAKVLNISKVGRTALFTILRNKKILMINNQPYQTYIDREYFRVIESKFTYPNGDTGINFKTVVYQKGVEYIRKIVLDYLDSIGKNEK